MSWNVKEMAQSIVGDVKVTWVFMSCLGAILLIHNRCLYDAFR